MLRWISAIAVWSFVFQIAVAQDEAAVGDAPQQIVERSVERFTEAFENRDAAAIASLFTEEAEYVDARGMVFHGRAAIEAEFAASFDVNPPATIDSEIVSIRPIAEGVLVEEGVSSFTPEGDGPTSHTSYSATHVKQRDGTWRIASIRELTEGQWTPHDRLTALEWLVGRWHEDVGGNVISTEWNWSNDGNFLIGEFMVRQSADVRWNGTHRIGWDAERKQFHSWIFESDGGAADGWWRPNGDGSWTVQLNGVDSQGIRRATSFTYATDGADALIVSQTRRDVGGQNLPGSSHRVVRQPPATAIVPSERESRPGTPPASESTDE